MWSVDVSVLEIYNERVRDLLSAGSVTHAGGHGAPGVRVEVDVHEVRSEHEGRAFSSGEAWRRWPELPLSRCGEASGGLEGQEAST